MRRKLNIFRARRGDRPADPRMQVVENEAALILHLAFGDVHLHVERRFNAEALCLREIGRCVPLPVDRWRAAEPRVGELVEIDEMEMGIDDAHDYSLSTVRAEIS